MLARYYPGIAAFRRLAGSRFRAYLEPFAASLAHQGYAWQTIRLYLRGAVHLGRWADRHRVPTSKLDAWALARFAKHSRTCRCYISNRSRGVHRDAVYGARCFSRFLVEIGVVDGPPPQRSRPMPRPPLIASFREWMLAHRGAKPVTLDHYDHILRKLLQVIGTNPSRYDATGLRSFILREG